MRPHGMIAAGLSLAALLVIGVGSTLARTSVGETNVAGNPNASCTSTSPCLEEDNKSTGSGLTGTSKKGTGVVGSTSFLSTSSTNAMAGVLGQDLNLSDKFNSGVMGTSKNGFGIFGVSTNNIAISGRSTKSTGVFGASVNGVGVTGSGGVGGIVGAGGTSGFGLEGFGFQGVVGANTTANNSDALLASGFGGNLIRANNSQNADVLTLNDSGLLALNGFLSVNGDIIGRGIIGDCEGACNTGVGVTAIGTYPGLVFEGAVGTNFVFAVDTLGNVVITGQIFTSGPCVNGCSRTRKIKSYVPHESTPMSEDVGEAQLVSGDATVRLDPAFANVIDRAANYLVFITPEGDNRGLYVTKKSATGFEVRESQSGHSTIAFSYRIVAKPYGESGARLPMVTLKSAPRPGFVKPHVPSRPSSKKISFPQALIGQRN